ncbi:MAG: serine hydrolase [Gammaproteobacteria bacterium]|nr:serine hydrolase [Gammaproteobacteria bacterium]
MKIKPIVLGLASLLLLSNLAFANTEAHTINPEHIVNETIKQLMLKDHIPGVAVDIYVNGRAHSYYYGYRNLSHKSKVDNRTLFEIGSLTKLFTSLLLAVEINQNNMQLNDPISKYLPALQNSQAPAASITLEQLATHTSGLPLRSPLPQSDLFNINTVATLHQYLLNWQPPAPLGTQWQYSNFGMGVLGMSIEDKVGWPYPELVKKYIFKPLTIKDAGINVPNWYFNYAQGYANGVAVPHWKLPMFPAGGAIEASPRDMEHFLSAALELPGTPLSLVVAMKQTQTPYVQTSVMQQGLGWEIYPFSPHDARFAEQAADKIMGPLKATQLSASQAQFNGNLFMQKTGATNGFRSFIAVVPNTKTGIVILANSYFNDGDIVNAGRSIMAQLIQLN